MLNIINSFVNSLNKLSSAVKYLLLAFLFLSSGSICFVSGMFNYDTKFEVAAKQISDIASTKTNDGSFASLIVTSKDKNSSLPGEYNEYNYWKYIFRHSNFGYLSTVNAEKKNDIHYAEVDNNKSITFICSNVNTCYLYQGKGYKHELYDLFFMFSGNRNIAPGAINFCAISKSMANSILKKRGYECTDNNYSAADYESLLGTNTAIAFDGTNYYFSIFNIYFENNEFYENSKTVFDEFVLSYTRFPDGYNKESTYIFNTYNYQNSHKLKRMNQFFSKGSYEIVVGKSNFKNTNIDIDNSKIFKVILNTKSDSTNSILLATLSIIIFAISLFVLFFLKFEKSRWIAAIISIVALFIPYLLFFSLYHFGGIVLTFSYFSLKFYAWVVIFDIVYMFFYIKRIRSFHEKNY